MRSATLATHRLVEEHPCPRKRPPHLVPDPGSNRPSSHRGQSGLLKPRGGNSGISLLIWPFPRSDERPAVASKSVT